MSGKQRVVTSYSQLITHHSLLITAVTFCAAQHTSILYARSIAKSSFYQLRLIFW
jgi:hypothetical protein